MDQGFEALKRNIGTLPLHSEEKEEEKKSEVASESTGPKVITKTIILPDGSYGTETIVLDDPSKKVGLGQDEDAIPLRKALKTADDDFLASCVAISITKLAVKSKKNL